MASIRRGSDAARHSSRPIRARRCRRRTRAGAAIGFRRIRRRRSCPAPSGEPLRIKALDAFPSPPHAAARDRTAICTRAGAAACSKSAADFTIELERRRTSGQLVSRSRRVLDRLSGASARSPCRRTGRAWQQVFLDSTALQALLRRATPAEDHAARLPDRPRRRALHPAPAARMGHARLVDRRSTGAQITACGAAHTLHAVAVVLHEAPMQGATSMRPRAQSHGVANVMRVECAEERIRRRSGPECCKGRLQHARLTARANGDQRESNEEFVGSALCVPDVHPDAGVSQRNRQQAISNDGRPRDRVRLPDCHRHSNTNPDVNTIG